MLSMTTGEVHPLGSKQEISASVHMPAGLALIKLGISDDYIGVMLWCAAAYSELWVWNWKTGALGLVGDSIQAFSYKKHDEHACQNLYGSANDTRMITSSFVLLSNQQVLVPVSKRISSVETQLALYVYNYNHGLTVRSSYDNAPRVATFQFPEYARGVDTLRLDAASNPYSTLRPPTGCGVSFYSDMRKRVVVLNIILSPTVDARPVGYYLFAPSDAIEQFCCGQDDRVVSWAEWADKVRLVQKLPLSLISDGHIFQLRCFTPEIRGDPHVTFRDAMPFVIYDFAQRLTLRRDAQNGDFSNCEYFFKPNTIEDPRIWKEIIVTGSECPYRKIHTNINLSLQTSMFSIMEDCIILGDERG